MAKYNIGRFRLKNANSIDGLRLNTARICPCQMTRVVEVHHKRPGTVHISVHMAHVRKFGLGQLGLA